VVQADRLGSAGIFILVTANTCNSAYSAEQATHPAKASNATVLVRLR
jgi:hypothetical protein